MNEVTLAGRLREAPQFKQSTTGKTYANFIIDIPGKDASGQPKVSGRYLTCWEEKAALLEGLEAGQPIVIKGSVFSKKQSDNTWKDEISVWNVIAL